MKKRDVIFIFLGILLIGVILVGAAKPRVKRYVQSLECGNYMSSIAVASRIWAEDNSNRLADNFVIMSNELCITKILICPSDQIHKIAGSWESFTTNNTSYEMLRPGMDGSDFSNAYFCCTIHGHLGYADGTVFDGKRRRTKDLW